MKVSESEKLLRRFVRKAFTLKYSHVRDPISGAFVGYHTCLFCGKKKALRQKNKPAKHQHYKDCPYVAVCNLLGRKTIGTVSPRCMPKRKKKK